MVRFLAPLFGVAVADIEVVFGQENVNKQLRIKAPQKLPAVFGSRRGSVACSATQPLRQSRCDNSPQPQPTGCGTFAPPMLPHGYGI